MAQHEFEPEEKLFDTAAQERIIHLAAEIQRAEAALLSRSEIERAAAEAGIEPRYVRLAMERLAMPQPARASRAELGMIVPACLLVLANAYFVTGMSSQRELNFWIPLTLAAVLGAAFSRTARERLFALALAPLSILLVTLWCVWTTSVGLGPAFIDQTLGFVKNFAVIELIVILLAQGLAALSRKAIAASRHNREPSSPIVR
jgi:hypothetical protein